ncbi:tetratricopeptide repeat protein [Streptomyces sp. NPDC018019]|uniref:tetratricopeptide repeat protein n=1 Tax=Streptomyces sp. NPDC018019 TaxID=3365030 RepID=UPI00378D893F
MKAPRRREDAEPPQVSAAQGANAAGRDVINSVALYAEQAKLLPEAAYGLIPDEAAQNGLSNIPRTAGFVGRADELDTLDAAFADPGAVVLHAVYGLGGVGKSALAAHWAAHRATAALRWWITADSAAAVDKGVADLAVALQPGLTELPAELRKERALHWLAGHGDWLIVLDNVDHPDHIRPLVDRVPGGRALITTRRSTGWHRLATTIPLEVLTPADSTALFIQVLTHNGPRDGDGTAQVCAELGHLALAVEQAAAFCAETATSPRAYLAMLRQWPAEMFAAGPEGCDSERTIARIWRITLDRLTDTPLAGQILRILAWYAPDHIPRTLLGGLAPPPVLAHAVGRLLGYSMITENGDGTLSVHRLLQALARTPDLDDPHRPAADINHARDHAATRLEDTFPADIDQPGHWPQCRSLLPHVEALAQHTLPDHDTTTTALLFRTAAFLLGQGATASAIRYFLRVHTTYEHVLGDDHPHTLTSRSNLAVAYYSAGDLTRAISLYERAVTGYERVLGDDHPDTLTSRSNLAAAHQAAGDLTRAITLHERTLIDRVRIFGDDHPDTLGSRNNLAAAYYSAGDLTRAISLYERAVTGYERVLGEVHPDTLTSRSNLAAAHQAAGDLTRAISLYERSITAFERVLGDDHPDTLASRSRLATAYQAAGDLTRAISLHERTLIDRVRILGDDHPHTLTSRNSLATTYYWAGDLTRAITLHERTLIDRVRVLGDDHPDTLNSRNNLAVAYCSAGDLTRAITLHERTLIDRVRILGDDHPDTLTSRSNLAAAYQAAGDLTRAISLYERSITAFERVLGDDHPDTLTSRSNLAAAYQAAGDLTRAISLYERTLSACDRVLSDAHPLTTAVQRNLAAVRAASAEPPPSNPS